MFAKYFSPFLPVKQTIIEAIFIKMTASSCVGRLNCLYSSYNLLKSTNFYTIATVGKAMKLSFKLSALLNRMLYASQEVDLAYQVRACVNASLK